MKYIKNNFKTNIKISHVLLYALLGASLSILINGLFIHFGLIKFKLEPSDVEAGYYYLAMFIRIVLSCIIGPFVEELLFRGILFNYLTKVMNVVMSAIITTLLFSIVHLSEIQFLFALLAGIVLIVFYIKTKNLLVTFIMHCSCNIAALFSILIKTGYVYLSVYTIVFIALLFICYRLKENK